MAGWTIETLKELFDRTIEDRDIRVNLALSAAKEAVTKAEHAADKRFELLNEFRAQQAEESRRFAPQELVQQKFDEMFGRLTRIESAVSILQGRALALAAFGTLFGGIVGALIVKFIT